RWLGRGPGGYQAPGPSAGIPFPYMANVKIRPLTIVCLVLAGLFVLGGIYYLVTPAHSLPSFVPGHEAHVTRHHVKHGLALFGLAVIALIGAWFTTTPDRAGST